jgi:Fic family protein
MASDRAGRYFKQPSGYAAFVPVPLNPPPKLHWDDEFAPLLVRAGTALGRLDGLTRRIPNPNLFVSIFVRQEAVLSSQIEGTQCTLEDVLKFELEKPSKEKEGDVRQVINYVEAINYGLSRLNDPAQGLPLCLRLIREIHSVLMEGRRGMHRSPGEFRRTQNWIGPQGSTLMTASFIPPPVPEMQEALGDFEKFLQLRSGIESLIQIGLAHAQFETIHPFLDGNGRLGRLLITLFLCERDILKRPVLYLSHYVKSNQHEYYRRLTAIREEGDWEGWLKFFFHGIEVVSNQAIRNAEIILDLRERHHALVAETVNTLGAVQMLDYLFENPVINVQRVSEHLDCTFATASKLVDQFEQLELLRETTGQKRNRQYEYSPYMKFWKTAQDDFGDIEAAEAVAGTAQIDVQPSSGNATIQTEDSEHRALEVLTHARKRIASEAKEIEWREQTKSGKLLARFAIGNSWLQLRLERYGKLTVPAELHPTLNEVYIYQPTGEVLFASFGAKDGGADIVWAFEYQIYNGRPSFKPVWEHSPYVEPLSAGELGKSCLDQLKMIGGGESTNTLPADLSVYWITNARKMIAVTGEDGRPIGSRLVSNEECRALLKELLGAESQAIDIDASRFEAQVVGLKDVDRSKLHASGLLEKFASERELELAGKDWILERFLITRDVVRKRTEGDIHWEDQYKGTSLVYYSDDVRHMVPFTLAEVRACISDRDVQKKIENRLTEEMERLPLPMRVEGPYAVNYVSPKGGTGSGSLRLNGGRISGNDEFHKWRGRYELHDQQILARLTIERTAAGDGVLGALDAGEIIFTGAVNGDEIQLRGYLSTDRSKQVKMDLLKSADAALFWGTNEFVGEF